MTLKITPERAASVYDCLRAFPPFCHWKLPPSGPIEFIITGRLDEQGAQTNYARTENYIIELSGKRIGHLNTLTMVMAHEMIHLYQAIRKTSTPNAQHNAEYRVIAKQVCRSFGWDPKDFVP